MAMKSERARKINETIQQATQALASSISTSYGPKGLDKMLIKDNKTVVTNDGATILSYYKMHPIHNILSGMSAAQDANCGDGTTSVVLLACCLYEQLSKLLNKGVHPSKIVDGLEIAKKLAVKYISESKIRISEDEFVDVALTSLNSKIASLSTKMATVAVEALRLSKRIGLGRNDIQIIKRTGGNIDDIELYNSVIIPNTNNNIPAGQYKMLVLQFCISAPKTNMDSKVLINDYQLMEQFVKDEREYVINIIKKIKKSGANLLVIQKSLLKESCSELARYFLKKLGIQFIDAVDRKEIENISKRMNIKPITDVELIREEGEDNNGITVGVPREVVIKNNNGMVEIAGHGCSIIVSGCDEIFVDEAKRSLDDAFGVVQSLMADPSIVPGGGAIETGISVLLENYTGLNSIVVNSLSNGFISMPFFLAQNAGVNSVEIISQLKKNITLNRNFGIGLKTGLISDMANDEKIIQPAAVSESMVVLAIEAVQMLVKIDDILPALE